MTPVSYLVYFVSKIVTNFLVRLYQSCKMCFTTYFVVLNYFTTYSAVSGPVMDLKTYSPDNSTLVISWRPPSTPNGNIISYTVRIENLRDGTTLRDIADLNAVTTSLTEDGLSNVISGLRFNIGVHFLVPGVPYRVSFIAVNRAGQGNITVLTNFTKELGMYVYTYADTLLFAHH